MRRGLTREEFRDLCHRHSSRWAEPPTRISTVTFLERCTEIGLVQRRVNGQGTVEYVATEALRGLFFDD